MATHSRILAWETPWTEEPGGLRPMGLQELDMTQQLNNKLCITLSNKNGQGVFQNSCLEGGCSVSLKHQISSVPQPPGGKPRAVCSCNFMCLRAQSCPTICDSMDQEPPGSSVHGISQQEYWSGWPFPSPGTFLTQRLNLHLLPCRRILYQ